MKERGTFWWIDGRLMIKSLHKIVDEQLLITGDGHSKLETPQAAWDRMHTFNFI